MNEVVIDQTLPWYVRAMRACWGQFEPNFCDVIAATRSHEPLKCGEQMIVRYDGKEYVITRKK